MKFVLFCIKGDYLPGVLVKNRISGIMILVDDVCFSFRSWALQKFPADLPGATLDFVQP